MGESAASLLGVGDLPTDRRGLSFAVRRPPSVVRDQRPGEQPTSSGSSRPVM